METERASDGKLIETAFREGVSLSIGSFLIRIRIGDPQVAREFCALYDEYPIATAESISDFRIELVRRRPFGSGLRVRLEAHTDRQSPLNPALPELGVPLLESAMNWYLGRYVCRFLLIHAAVLEKEGVAVVMPGDSGSGKSTLTAGLVGNGWRLLSDEAALIDLKTGLLQPHPRPISLKNDSIDLIGDRYPGMAAARRYDGTPKGTVAFLKAPSLAVAQAHNDAKPGLVVFPKFGPDEPGRCERVEKAEAFMRMVRQSPNYRFLLECGFTALADLAESCDHHDLVFSELDGAIARIERLHEDLREVHRPV